MDEKKLAELKFHFEKIMEKYSNRNKDSISTAWEKLVDLHKERPYHNLNLAFNDLKQGEILGYNIPYFGIIAAVLRYADFDPKCGNNTERVVNYAKFFLEQPFGWRDNNIKEVLDAVRASFVITAPSPNESYGNRLMHDMKMARFAKIPKYWIEDRLNSKKEFSHIPEKRFYQLEQTLLSCYQESSNFFSLEGFRPLLFQAQENIKNRAAYVREIIKHLESLKK